MTPGFLLAAAAMLGIALFAVLRPLLVQHSGASAQRGVALLLALSLPLLGASLYWRIGTPTALAGVPLQPLPPVAPDQTAQRLQGWLQQAWDAQQAQRPHEAQQAFAQALWIAPANVEALLGWAETDMAQHADLTVGSAARAMLDRVLAQQPDNQRALWMRGIAAFQQQRYADAANDWRHLLSLLPAGSPLRNAVTQKIAAAEAMLAAPAAATTTPR
ncbi:TPR domain-containing protein [Xanthomonas rydalmerensis]|uniref:Cytochrome C biogenesis protein n=1 Tax=Xanthomonas rydalmerensis TaxID=3046274 RepID=A0ABZ0JSM3_9XANT|nr:cytochrome C biogenesis protein [Xanthomonas sp. DM-2023]WOS42829.1 cytochrome C biogenesis protein [Xanthomonas sp. DM-2023]WOS47016.1 cytochrome C biogenesis protein [Xanthomonas sp. DM-2023]WOS51195.1 cytochrome C biogenesis protein [Xanthomonas sp. DM-2023]WOS55376.1 cytochrome C biogenesis protein [Xanthomonas sp. DM-2023]WOS59558.1 cytochrome C biogenesis protein [Xanthomonas sp. DM-2023]